MAPLLAVSGTDEGVEFTGATQANQLEYQRRFSAEGIAFDIWWIDAGWYPCRDDEGKADWTITGTWRPDPDLWVPTMLSQPLTWCSPAGPWRRSSASGCRSVQQSGAVSTCVTTTRLPGGAPRVRLARLAGPL